MKHTVLLTLLFAFNLLATGQKIGINTNSPTATLDVNGTIRIRGGSPATGRVLTSDANGVGSWQLPADANWTAFRSAGLYNGVAQALPHQTWVKLKYFQTPQYNVGDGFDGTTSNFVAPAYAVYHFNVRADLENYSYETHMRLMQKRGATVWEAAYIRLKSSYGENWMMEFPKLSINTDLLAQAGDTFWVELYQSGSPSVNVSPLTRASWFSAHLITPY